MIPCIIPIAGYGTRVLPLTKAIPKELLPVNAKPAIQHIVDDIYDNGISSLGFVVSPGPSQTLSYFTPDYRRYQFSASEQRHILEELEENHNRFTIWSVIQEQAYGLGHAIIQALMLCQDAPFVCIALGDVLLAPQNRVFKHMLAQAQDTNTSVVLVNETQYRQATSYGCCLVSNNNMVTSVIEKPSYAIIQEYAQAYQHIGLSLFPNIVPTLTGRYVLTNNDIQSLLNEYQQTQTCNFSEYLNQLAIHNKLSYYLYNNCYDIGSISGWQHCHREFTLHDW